MLDSGRELQGEVPGVHTLPCTLRGVKGMKETKGSRGERAIMVNQSVAQADGAPHLRMLLAPCGIDRLAIKFGRFLWHNLV